MLAISYVLALFSTDPQKKPQSEEDQTIQQISQKIFRERIEPVVLFTEQGGWTVVCVSEEGCALPEADEWVMCDSEEGAPKLAQQDDVGKMNKKMSKSR